MNDDPLSGTVERVGSRLHVAAALAVAQPVAETGSVKPRHSNHGLVRVGAAHAVGVTAARAALDANREGVDVERAQGRSDDRNAG